jgi:CBS domain-containing protein
MSAFQVPLSLYMSAPVQSLDAGATLHQAQDRLSGAGVSALPVREGVDGPVVGILSRSDLLRVGRTEGARRPADASLTLPDRTVRDEMSEEVPFLPASADLSRAASQMVRDRVHRILVGTPEAPEGIVTPLDLMAAIEDQELGHPVSAFMSSPVFTVRAEEPVSVAVERLARARVTGLVVVEGSWPVGVFTEVEALEARDHPRQTPVGELMSPRLLVLGPDTRMHRAAAQARATRVRRVVVQEEGRLVGILSGLDFARAASGA